MLHCCVLLINKLVLQKELVPATAKKFISFLIMSLILAKINLNNLSKRYFMAHLPNKTLT